ncbi:UPF0234 protein [Pseudohongiella nitratireducens]|uniref:Nucleotide-binding protein GCM10011403_22690 n=1 Tax=Pseudohongiella nitratireducens TaxID=1768907 RepID=A0A916VJY6_9GAMM|nr:YajQ family cyclic di-GMP-binding protein [Pseudohongiella nitratireducens]MDF1623027.1 YajQ family cyclic di-GMP-binding protein [Pseudohongiella nitratireducens]GFZ78993.1 UPF0234 protein [Pseudohongiella nitratireducens]|tara:strand:+ start:4287 stop:4769 length:483 start_codon:yes stop_codon:yes gene_type:complete
MPSFDVVSEIELAEVRNAVDQANREIGTRFDFKGVDASFELNDAQITVSAEAEFQVQQMLDILRNKLIKRNIDIKSMQEGDIVESGKKASMDVTMQQGIDTDIARAMVKKIKASGVKVQAAIQGDKVRVTGKKRDDLQAVIAHLKDSDFDIPLQYNNFRD